MIYRYVIASTSVTDSNTTFASTWICRCCRIKRRLCHARGWSRRRRVVRGAGPRWHVMLNQHLPRRPRRRHRHASSSRHCHVHTGRRRRGSVCWSNTRPSVANTFHIHVLVHVHALYYRHTRRHAMLCNKYLFHSQAGSTPALHRRQRPKEPAYLDRGCVVAATSSASSVERHARPAVVGL